MRVRVLVFCTSRSAKDSSPQFIDVPGCWQVFSLTRKETSYSDQTLTFASHSKKFQKVARPTRYHRQQLNSASDEKWRPFNCFFQSGRAKDLSAPLYVGKKMYYELHLFYAYMEKHFILFQQVTIWRIAVSAESMPATYRARSLGLEIITLHDTDM